VQWAINTKNGVTNTNAATTAAAIAERVSALLWAEPTEKKGADYRTGKRENGNRTNISVQYIVRGVRLIG
jgi:hypothetical protein